MKTTKETTAEFYNAMLNNQGWEDFLAEQATYLGPLASLVEGKENVVNITHQFLNNKQTGEVKNIISEGNQACVLTHYQIGHPSMALLEVDACEIINIEDGKVLSMEVYFDSLKVSEFGQKMQKMQEGQ
ncbi:MAG: nuclear transport factor 2 family protein [Bacteroidia bacterium]|nr:nuclear transport factor 2 family protein [Bacteroidia bacterium]